MNFNNDNLTTQQEVITQGHTRLTQEELIAISSNKTITGHYYYNNQWRRYMSYTNPNGEIEGINDLGTFEKGRWSVNTDGLYSVNWARYWENWSAYAYRVGTDIKFYDTTTQKWLTTFNNIVKGELPLEVV